MRGTCHPEGAQLLSGDSLSPETAAATQRYEADILGRERMGSKEHKPLGQSGFKSGL